MLQIYNSLTNTKEQFTPIIPGQVRMYVCGMTVYDYCHLGHARVMIVFDMVYRYLKALNYTVTYVRNITDIDDKIIHRAQQIGEPFTVLTERFIQALHEDAAALDILPPDHEPRASQHIAQILEMIQKLVDKGYAYAGDNGDVYYAVNLFTNYGQLSGKAIKDLRAGARVEIAEAKRDPLDFVLWKAAKPGEPAWESPWGQGRPGWHIECSAMSTHCLGQHFDIHGGGADLQFPHHENEIAQSEGAHDEKFVNIWMHNGFVRINEEKMAKTLGNFLTIRDILKSYRSEEIRLFMLTSHYRSPLNYDVTQLDNARAALFRLYTALRGLPINPYFTPATSDFAQRFHAAMDDDFNTPEALAVLFDLVRELNKLRNSNAEPAIELGMVLRYCGNVLGLLQADPEQFLQHNTNDGLSDNDIVNLINQRTLARKNKNWSEADRMRKLLAEQGIALEDSIAGTTWRRVL